MAGYDGGPQPGGGDGADQRSVAQPRGDFGLIVTQASEERSGEFLPVYSYFPVRLSDLRPTSSRTLPEPLTIESFLEDIGRHPNLSQRLDLNHLRLTLEQLSNQYTIRAYLGEGALAIAVLATDQDGRAVVIKITKKPTVSASEENSLEKRVLQHFEERHRARSDNSIINTPRIIYSNDHVTVQSLAPGVDMTSYMAEGMIGSVVSEGTMPLVSTLRILAKCLTVLADLHSVSYCAADLQVQDIFLLKSNTSDFDPQVTIIDWNVVLPLSEHPSDQLSHDGSLQGVALDLSKITGFLCRLYSGVNVPIYKPQTYSELCKHFPPRKSSRLLRELMFLVNATDQSYRVQSAEQYLRIVSELTALLESDILEVLKEIRRSVNVLASIDELSPVEDKEVAFSSLKLRLALLSDLESCVPPDQKTMINEFYKSILDTNLIRSHDYWYYRASGAVAAGDVSADTTRNLERSLSRSDSAQSHRLRLLLDGLSQAENGLLPYAELVDCVGLIEFAPAEALRLMRGPQLGLFFNQSRQGQILVKDATACSIEDRVDAYQSIKDLPYGNSVIRELDLSSVPNEVFQNLGDKVVTDQVLDLIQTINEENFAILAYQLLHSEHKRVIAQVISQYCQMEAQNGQRGKLLKIIDGLLRIGDQYFIYFDDDQETSIIKNVKKIRFGLDRLDIEYSVDLITSLAQYISNQVESKRLAPEIINALQMMSSAQYLEADSMIGKHSSSPEVATYFRPLLDFILNLRREQVSGWKEQAGHLSDLTKSLVRSTVFDKMVNFKKLLRTHQQLAKLFSDEGELYQVAVAVESEYQALVSLKNEFDSHTEVLADADSPFSSPAEALEQAGYDIEVFLQYATQHRASIEDAIVQIKDPAELAELIASIFDQGNLPVISSWLRDPEKLKIASSIIYAFDAKIAQILPEAPADERATLEIQAQAFALFVASYPEVRNGLAERRKRQAKAG